MGGVVHSLVEKNILFFSEIILLFSRIKHFKVTITRYACCTNFRLEDFGIIIILFHVNLAISSFFPESLGTMTYKISHFLGVNTIKL